MNHPDPLVIVGASYAGAQVAASARDLGYEAPIILVGDEKLPPYQRPPLSKGILNGKTEIETLALRSDDFYRDQSIELLLQSRATSIDRVSKKVFFQDSGAIKYGTLALTTGARCRDLLVPGRNLAGIFQLRTLEDALVIRHQMAHAKSACIIGGGFIGLEVASALSAQGLNVTVLEMESRLLTRNLAPTLSHYLFEVHRSQDVTIHLGQRVIGFHGDQGQVQRVELSDGSQIDCDLVVLGIGVQPNVELAEQASVACQNGILTDALGRTSHPNIYAVGDVANTVLPAVISGPSQPQLRMRLESIQAASDGARAAASSLVGKPQPFEGAPWFWSEQYDLKIQMTGLYRSTDQEVLRGDLASNRFTLFYLRNQILVAAHSVNRPAEHMWSRKTIIALQRLDPSQLADPSVDLKSLFTPL